MFVIVSDQSSHPVVSGKIINSDQSGKHMQQTGQVWIGTWWGTGKTLSMCPLRQPADGLAAGSMQHSVRSRCFGKLVVPSSVPGDVDVPACVL